MTTAMPQLSKVAPMARRPFVGIIHATIAEPTVDRADHVLYGLGGKPDNVPAISNTILRVNELTGRITVLTRFGGRHLLQWLALDPSTHHLIVADKRIDRWPSTREGFAVVTTMAHIVDVRSGRAMSTIRVSRFSQRCCAAAEGSIAVDASVRHGFIVDVRGNGVMVDTRSGRLLARFHVGQMGNAAAIDTDAAVDSRIHRLFLGLLESPNLGVVSTLTGRVAGWRLHPNEPTGDVAVDQKSGRVFGVGYGHLSILDARSGRLLHRTRVGDLALLMLYDNRTQRLFFLVDDSGGKRSAFLWRTVDAGSGRLLRAVRLSDVIEPSGVVDRRAGRIYVDTGYSGRFLVFDAQTGALLARLPTRTGGPNGMGVDETTHRVFAAGAGTLTILDSCPRC
jgi:hypothetical protein